MCSHILSDIEVLCDRIAIMKNGRLAHIGYLNELQERAGSRNLEIVATGTDAASFKLDGLQCEVSATAAGLRIEVPDEKDVDEVIKALRNAGGKLVSVQPVRQSLEELFLDDA